MRLRDICILTLMMSGAVYGQKYPFIRYGTAEGLPGDHVTDVVSDHRGFLWAAMADRGITRFDGREFVQFHGSGLRMSGGVAALATDGNRWLFAGGGDGVRAILLDASAADRIDTEINLILRPVRGHVRALRRTREGRIYIESTRGAWLFSPRDSSLARCRVESAPFAFLQPRLAGMVLRDMAKDCEGLYWIATDSGLVQLSDVSRHVFGPRQGLPTVDITSVCIDQEAGIWCGSSSGLYHYTPERFFTLTFGDSVAVTCMHDTRERGMYFGTRGHGVYRLFDGPRKSITVQDGLPSNDIHSLHRLSTGELLIVTDNGIVIWGERGVESMPESLKLPDPRVRQMYLAANRSYWFATMGGLVCWDHDRSMTFGLADGFPSVRVNCLTEDAYGFIIAGTDNGAVRVRATGGGIVERIPELQGLCITALLVDEKNRLWIGTKGGGVIVGIEGKYRVLGSAQGLAGGNIAFIGRDNYGSFYFGHNRGVSVLSQRNLQYVIAVDSVYNNWENMPPAQLPFLRAVSMFTLTEKMGLEAGHMQSGAVHRDRIGRMWFGGDAGVSSYTPAKHAGAGSWIPPPCRLAAKSAEHAVPLRIILSELSINDTITTIREEIEMGTRDRVLRARLLLPSFRNPGQVRFLYQLRGLENAWHECSDGRILYSGLKPGSYTLVVQAGIGEDIWSERQTLLRIEVLAPIGQRWWFWLIVLLAAVSTGIFVQRTISRWRDTVNMRDSATRRDPVT